MARALSARTRSLRGRLLSAFMLAAVVPLLVFGALVIILVSRRFEDTTVTRLNGGLAAVQRRIEDLPKGELEPGLGTRIAESRGLQMLELIDANGHVLASHHWLAGLGLPERDRRFGGSRFSLETVGAGYGSTEQLAVTAVRRQPAA